MNSPPWYPGANAGVSFGNTAPQNPVRGHFWWTGQVLALFDGAVWVNTTNGSIIGDGGGGTGTGSVIISSTPPGNPSAGTQWWDGSVMRMWDGATWQLIGPGSAAGPVPTTTVALGLSAPVDFPMNATPGSYGIINFTATPQVDTMLGYSVTTHKYMPTKPGMYMFTLRTWTGTQAGFSIAKNDPGTYSNTPTSDIVVAVSSSSAAGFMSATGITLMNGTTDFVRCFGWNVDGNFHSLGGNAVFSGIQLP